MGSRGIPILLLYSTTAIQEVVGVVEVAQVAFGGTPQQSNASRTPNVQRVVSGTDLNVFVPNGLIS